MDHGHGLQLQEYQAREGQGGKASKLVGPIKYLTKIFVFKLERPKISGKNNSDKKI